VLTPNVELSGVANELACKAGGPAAFLPPSRLIELPQCTKLCLAALSQSNLIPLYVAFILVLL